MKRLIFLCSLPLVLAACGNPSTEDPRVSVLLEAWNEDNDPARLRESYEVRLDALPLKAELERKPWADTYWPNYKAGIADRWNDPARPDPFTYSLHDEATVRGMGEDQLKTLSPAEKYDIFAGRFQYPLVISERERTKPDDPSWFGLCHGWAPAAFNFEEPRPVTLMGDSGVTVPFGSSDVKALLLYAQQYGTYARSVGRRCNHDSSSSNACRDINAGSFHVVLTNQIGIIAQGFVAEIARGSQVWNQPVYGYSTQILSESNEVYEKAAPGTVKIVNVKTQLGYVAEIGPNWDPMPFADYPGQRGRKTYEYSLELNAAGEIIGGEWVSQDHPDFFWTQTPPRMTGFFAALKKIYEAAVQ